MRLLGIAKATRASNYPDLPTIAETVPGFESGGWFGFVAPARTPRQIITVLNREANAAMKRPDIRAKLETLGVEVWTESPEYLRDLMKSEFYKYGEVARDNSGAISRAAKSTPPPTWPMATKRSGRLG